MPEPGAGENEEGHVSLQLQHFLDGAFKPRLLTVHLDREHAKVRLSNPLIEGEEEATLINPGEIFPGMAEVIQSNGMGVFPIQSEVQIALGKPDSLARVVLSPNGNWMRLRTAFNGTLINTYDLDVDTAPFGVGRFLFLPSDPAERHKRNELLPQTSRLQGFVAQLPQEPFLSAFGVVDDSLDTAHGPSPVMRSPLQHYKPLPVGVFINRGMNPVYVLGPDLPTG